MTPEEFRASVGEEAPPSGLPAPLRALWWDAKGDWSRAHAFVDELESTEGMAVHAYLHRKEVPPRTPITGTSGPGGTFIGPHSILRGKL